MSNQNNSKVNLRKFLPGIIAGLLIFLTVLAFAIPLTMTDGTEKYEGAERKAAEAVMSYAPSLPDGASRFFSGHLKTRVEKVTPTPPNTAKVWCNLSEKDSGEGHFSVTVSYRTIFGIITQQFERHDACTHL